MNGKEIMIRSFIKEINGQKAEGPLEFYTDDSMFSIRRMPQT